MIRDGRPLSLRSEDSSSLANFCGITSVRTNATLQTSSFTLRAQQHTSGIIFQSTEHPTAIGSLSLRSGSAKTSTRFVISPPRCHYIVGAGSTEAVVLKINALDTSVAELEIYGGLYGYDSLLASSLNTSLLGSTLIAPCGTSVMVLTFKDDFGNESIFPVLNFTYYLGGSDDDCARYRKSLDEGSTASSKFSKELLYMLIALGIVALGIGVWGQRKRLPIMVWSKFRYAKLIAPHPRHTPALDNLRNRMLPVGECTVCRGISRCFSLECKHLICKEDLQSYLQSALGDISLFPVKCPMHFEKCTGAVGPLLAKRLLNKKQYDKFLDFHDRAVYGDGMRCIFCNHFVNFPTNNNLSMVQCPYCTQVETYHAVTHSLHSLPEILYTMQTTLAPRDEMPSGKY
jgi:hypothetical protein